VPGKATGERRRHFSLPPLDDDHERVSRSIETFLSGTEPNDSADAQPAPVATTVAIVAVDGRRIVASSPDRAAFDGVVATVDRTLRSAARAADRVMSTGPGRFRIVLPATGELAARTYLRRVRATVEPSLEAASVPLRLIAATATVLDGTPEAASALAQTRIDAALANVPWRMSDEEPRAAGD